MSRNPCCCCCFLGALKFIGHWNTSSTTIQSNSSPAAAFLAKVQSQTSTSTSTTTTSGNKEVPVIATLASSISQLVNEADMAGKMATAISSLIKVAEFFAEETTAAAQLAANAAASTAHTEQQQQQQHNSSSSHAMTIAAAAAVVPVAPRPVQRSFMRNNLDVASVLRTVLDYYESFSRTTCLQLRLDTLKSMIYLANCLFDSRHQYEALLAKLLSTSRPEGIGGSGPGGENNATSWLDEFIDADRSSGSGDYAPLVNELVDDATLAAAIYAECMCRCCLHASSTSSGSKSELERVCKLIENALAHPSLSVRLAAVHGLFYWLEAIALGFHLPAETARQLVDQLCKQVNAVIKEATAAATGSTATTQTGPNARYVATLWSAVFYTIENCLDSIRDAPTFVAAFMRHTCALLVDAHTPYFLFQQLYMGLERLLLSNMAPSAEMHTIQRLLLAATTPPQQTTPSSSSSAANNSNNANKPPPLDEQRSLCLTSLSITSLYACNHEQTGSSRRLNYWHDIVNVKSNGMCAMILLNIKGEPY